MHVAAVAAHDHDVVDAGGGERVELPVQDGAPADLDHALGDLVGLVARGGLPRPAATMIALIMTLALPSLRERSPERSAARAA